MKNKLLVTEFLGGVFVAIFTFIFHFLFKWSGYNYLVGIFAATNESVFQHTKILFYPFLIYSIIEYYFLNMDFKRFVIAKAISSISLILMVIVFFYTYTGIIGHHIMIVDIISAILYGFIASGISYWLLTTKKNISKLFKPILIIFLVVLFFMIYFSVNPSKLPLFYDELHKTYSAVKQ